MIYYAELNLISIILCFIIQRKEAKDKQEIFESRAFRNILFILEFILILDTASLLIQENVIPHTHYIHLAVMNGYFILQSLFPLELLRYCVGVNSIQSRQRNILITVPFLLAIVSILINSFRPFAYAVVENDRYERLSERGFFMIVVWPIIYICLGIVIITKNYFTSDGKKKEIYGHIIVFSIFSLGAGILSIMFKGFLLWPFIALDLIYLYLNVLSKTNHKLDILAFKDSLTGIGNAASYESYTEHIRELIKNDAAEFAVVVMDANGLKYINDNLGHEAGNSFIKSCAMFICRIFDHSPVFRIGGDEFVAVLEKSDYINREELIRQFDEEMKENYIEIGDDKLRLSIARGIYDYSRGMSYSDVFYQADSLMYINKEEVKKRDNIPSR